MTCYARDAESQTLWNWLDKSKNALMLAPRRIGKTMLLHRLYQEAASKGYRALVLDVEGFRDEKAFFQQMCSQIQEELSFGASLLTTLTDKIRQTLKGSAHAASDWRELLLHTQWDEFAQHLLAHLNQDEKPWVILVDELPLFMLDLVEAHGPERASAFLYTLRRFRQKYRNIRWLYAGSIGLDTVARRHSLEGALNDLEIFTLQPFSAEIAAGFVRHLAQQQGRSFAEDAIRHLLQRTGWLAPYYLEKLADEACAQPGVGPIGIAAVDAACEALLAVDKRSYWSTWREHLERNFQDPEKARLFALLKCLAHAPNGEASESSLLTSLYLPQPEPETALRRDLDTLLSDGYLSEIRTGNTGARYRFRMGLLRDWWQRYVAPTAAQGA